MGWKIKEPRLKNPRGGWKFHDEYTGITIKEDTPEALITRIGKIRENTGRDVGDPAGDVAKLLSVSDPWMVRFVPDEPRSEKKSRMEAVERWLFGRRNISPKLINPVDAQRRAQICEQCPRNKNITHEDEEERERYWRVLMISSKGLCETYRHLGICDYHNHDNKLAVWLEDEGPSDCCRKGGPENCWKL